MINSSYPQRFLASETNSNFLNLLFLLKVFPRIQTCASKFCFEMTNSCYPQRSQARLLDVSVHLNHQFPRNQIGSPTLVRSAVIVGKSLPGLGQVLLNRRAISTKEGDLSDTYHAMTKRAGSVACENKGAAWVMVSRDLTLSPCPNPVGTDSKPG